MKVASIQQRPPDTCLQRTPGHLKVTFSDLHAALGPPISVLLAGKTGLQAEKVTLSDLTGPKVLSTHSPLIGETPGTMRKRTAGSENVTFSTNYEGQSHGWGRSSAENRRDGSEKVIERTGPWVGKRHCRCEITAYKREEDLPSRVGICHLLRCLPGRNLSPSALRAGRIASPLEPHTGSENVTFEAWS